MKRVKMTKCRFCGGTEFITGYQNFYGAVYSADSMLRSTSLYHTICRDCGRAARSGGHVKGAQGKTSEK